MNEEFELRDLNTPDNNNEEGRRKNEDDEVTPGNGACSNDKTPSEDDQLLPTRQNTQVTESNGGNCVVDGSQDPESTQRRNTSETGCGRIKRELNEPVIWKLKVWMVFLGVLIVIALVILISVIACSVQREDVDEQYDASLFTVPRIFKGNFTLKPLSLPTPEDLQQKLTHIYTSSPALGRYFYNATVEIRRSDVDYELMFRMPEEHEELMHYILSRKMVYNVLLQNLLDEDVQDELYIMPSSLRMNAAN